MHSGAKYSHSVWVTRLCRNFLPDGIFLAFDWVFVALERIKSTYNSCLHAVWTPPFLPEDVPIESSSKEKLEEEDLEEKEDEPELWRQPSPTDSRAFMSSIWKGMNKIFKGQTRLQWQIEEQFMNLDRIGEGLRRSRSIGLSTSAGPGYHQRWYMTFTYFMYLFLHSYHTLGIMHEICMGEGINIGFSLYNFLFILGYFLDFLFSFRFL